MSGSRTGGFSISITATDAATKTIDAINKRLAALNAPAERFNKALTKFGDVSGVSRVTEGIRDLGRSSLDAFRSLDRMASPLAAITSAASIAGVVELSRRWAEFGNQIGNVAYRTSLPVEKLTSLRGAARLAGVQASALDSGMKGLQDTLSAAAYGRDSGAVQMFNALGVAFKDTNGNARRAGDVLGDVADKIKALKPETQARVLNSLGIGEEMLPLLKNGRTGLEEFRKEAEKTGSVMTTQMVENAGKMNKAWNELGLTIEGVGNHIMDDYAPAVTKALDYGAKWIERNQNLAKSIGEIGTAVGLIAALKPAAWVLRLLGLGGVSTAVSAGAPWVAAASLSGDTHADPDVEPGGEWFGANGPIARWWHRTFGGGSGGGARKLSALGANERAKAAHDYYRSQGWSETQTDAILGYFAEETGGTLDPHAFNPDGGGMGAMGAGQWRGPRITRFAQMHGGKVPTQGTWQDQYEYAEWELENTETGAAAALRNARTPEEAATAMRSFGRGPADQQAAIQGNILRYGAGFQEQFAPDGTGAGNGHVQVDVHLHNAPPGTTANVASSGPVKAPPPRVDTSMPLAN